MIEHYGLYFSAAHVRAARKGRNHPPFKAAYALLNGREALDVWSSVQWNALRWRFSEDNAAAARAADLLTGPLLLPVDDDAPYLTEIMHTLLLAQAFEMLRDHPALPPGAQARWLDTFWGRVSALVRPPQDCTFVEAIWSALLRMTAGIVLEREPVFEAGAEVFRAVIDTEVRPQGYMPAAVEDADGFQRFLLAVQGMVLMAEAARHVGVDLWRYHNRGVSVVTAGLYPLDYFHEPERWPWGEALEPEEAQRVFKQHAGYLEILHHQIRPLGLRLPNQVIEKILGELRPVYDLYGGGLTTLTHGVSQRRGLFG